MSNALRGQHPLRDLIFLYNPVYLLSSVCMLASCVLLTNDSEHKNVPIGQLLSIVGTLAVYQACLFCIGSFLAIARKVLRDGRTLLVLDAIFLSDITFVNSELLTTDLRIGLGIGLLLFALSALRIQWITGRMECPMPLHRYLIILLQLLLIVAIPGYLKHIDTGTSIEPNTLYAMWWVGGLVLAGTVLADHAHRVGTARLAPRAAWVQPTYLTVTWLSLILHLAVLHYVYNVSMYGAMVCPILVALAMLLRRRDERVLARDHTLGFQAVLLIAALLLGVSAPPTLGLVFWGVSISATKLTLAYLYFAIVYMYFRQLAHWLLSAGVLAGALSVFGPGWRTVAMYVVDVVRQAFATAGSLLPSTRVGWGITGILLSFLLLGLGLLISLRKPPDDHRQAQPAPPEPEPIVPPVSPDPQPT